MNEMIERVARALAKMHGGDPDWTGYQSGPADDARPMWMRRVEEARTAIEAMLELTDEMRGAAINTGLPGVGDPPLYEMMWRNMIAAALAD